MHHEAAVIGLGAMGSATLYQLARRGVRVIGIDRFDPPHTMGSSHGESRITRLSVGEGANVAPFVARSHTIWRELEAQSGTELMRQTGGLILASPKVGIHHGRENFLTRCIDVARRFGIEHSILDADAIMARFPQFQLEGDETGFFEPEAGYVHPERCIATQLALAEAHGATILRNTEVIAITQSNGQVTIQTSNDTLTANTCTVTAGPWIGPLIGTPMQPLTPVHRQTLHWYEAADPAAYAPEKFPVFIWMHGAGDEEYFYGFPQLPGSTGVKLASERYSIETTADTVSRTVSPEESQVMHARHIHGRLAGIGPQALRSAACLYTVTPDHDFIMDRLPDADRVLVVSACSGHGFKHSAGIGEALAQTITEGGSEIDLTSFTRSRF